ncbi:MAG: hypothetical protein LBJ48_00595, partial [Coriobacteriales bacterium]|nr:hypothetical protein [Coriobacteriales bacterium]
MSKAEREEKRTSNIMRGSETYQGMTGGRTSDGRTSKDRQTGRSWPKALASVALVLLTSLVLISIQSMLTGLLSYVLALTSPEGYTLSELRGVVDVIATVATLAWVPVTLHFLFVSVLSLGSVKDRLTHARRTLKGRYLALLALLLAALALGWLVAAASEAVPDMLLRHIIRITLSVVLGIAALILMFTLYRGPRDNARHTRGSKGARPSGNMPVKVGFTAPAQYSRAFSRSTA